MLIEWPYDDQFTTYIVGHPRCIKLISKSREKFVKELKELGDVPLKQSIEFIEDEQLSDEYLYVVDCDGIQLIVSMEWPVKKKKKKGSKTPIDITKFDA